MEQYPSMSRRLQEVAQYVLDNPNDMAIETLAVIADRIGGQPSTIVRFAKAIGYDGASAIRRLFRDELLSGQHALGYRERIRRFKQETAQASRPTLGKLLADFVEGSVLALEHLRNSTSETDLAKAARSIERADIVFVAGFARSFPVASYIAYALQRLGKRCVLVDGVGGFAEQQIDQARQNDLLIATGFEPYSREIRNVVSKATKNGIEIIAISDSQVSPVVASASTRFLVTESEVRNFRSLTATLVLVQSIVIGYAIESMRISPSIGLAAVEPPASPATLFSDSAIVAE